jgi:hypothetical protein
MTHRRKSAIEALAAALVMGILGDVLLRETPWGLNVLLFNLAFAGALCFLLKRHSPALLNAQSYALLGALGFFASMFVWRDSIELRVADTFAIIAILGILFLRTLGVTPRFAGVVHYAVGVVWAGLNSAFAAVPLLGSDISWSESLADGWKMHLVSVVRGVLVAAPLILIFGGLFMAADAMYEGWVRSTFNLDFEDFLSHLLLISFFAWMTAGYFRGILFGGLKVAVEGASPIRSAAETLSSKDKAASDDADVLRILPDHRTVLEHINISDPPAEKASANENVTESRPETSVPPTEKKTFHWAAIENSIVPGFTLGSVEVGVILGLINALFLSFVVFQIPYLFGGMELVRATPDFKLAEYARRGFGELVAVSALVLPLLLAVHWLVKKEDRFAETLFKILAGAQIAMLFVIMASAMQRLILLTGPLGYGMTTVRLYPMIFMTWLAIVFVLFIATVLRGARNHFAWAALWSAFLVLGATHVLNPDAFIVKTNLALMQQGRDFDPYYNVRELSDDAIPGLLLHAELMKSDDRCIVASELRARFNDTREELDLRSWNLSRSASRAMLAEDAVITDGDRVAQLCSTLEFKPYSGPVINSEHGP